MIADAINAAPMSTKTDTVPEYIKGAAPPVAQLRNMLDNHRDLTKANRLLADRDRDYYDGPEQLNSEVRRILETRKQPPIYSNRIRPAIDGILGVLEAAKVDPRAYPRNPSPDGENASDVATKTLRYIADINRFQQTKLDCAENFLIEGVCAAIIEGATDDVPVTQIRYEEFFYDPYSRRPDFKDAKYLGVAKWMDAGQVRAAYPQATATMGEIFTSASGTMGALDSTFGDRPETGQFWIDQSRRRVMTVEVYYNDVKPPEANAQWYRCVYIAQGVLEHDVSPYRNVKTGETQCPIEAQSCYVNRHNARYGRIRDSIPIQDEINARRSRLLHLANSRQIQEIEMGAATVDAEVARQEAARADGVIPSGWKLVPTNDLAAGQQLLLAESKSEIERMGPTPAVLGRQGEQGQSGRARQVLQQAGMTEIARPLGRLEDWETRCYRAMWNRAQQFWTKQMYVRVTDEVRSPEFLKINEPAVDEQGMPVPDVDPQTGQPKPQMGPDGQPMVDPATGQPVPAQKVKNRLAEMDMDIIIDTAPDTANLEQEVWSELLDLSKTVPIGTPQFMIALEMSPLPDKQRVLDRIKAWQKEQQGQPDPAQEEAKAVALAAEKAKVENTLADTEVKRATVAADYFAMGQQAAAIEGVEHAVAFLSDGESPQSPMQEQQEPGEPQGIPPQPMQPGMPPPQ